MSEILSKWPVYTVTSKNVWFRPKVVKIAPKIGQIAPKIGQIGPKWDKSGTFSGQILDVLKFDLKKSRICPI